MLLALAIEPSTGAGVCGPPGELLDPVSTDSGVHGSSTAPACQAVSEHCTTGQMTLKQSAP